MSKLGSLKGFNFKAFFLQHGEKVGMGTAGLIVLGCLGMTNWSSTFAETPQAMQDKAAKMETDLRANRWPEAKQAEFALVPKDREVARMTKAIELAAFDYDIPLSPKLYLTRMPADEPKILPPAEMRAKPVQFAMLQPGAEPEFAGSADDEEDPDAGRLLPAPGSAKPSAKEKSGSKDKKASKAAGGSLTMGAMPMSMMGMASGSGMGAMMGMVGAQSGDTKGYQAVVLTGVVERRQQLDLLKTALHLEMPSQAAALLKYTGFQVQRQRAIPGGDPWAGPWEDLDIKATLTILKEEVGEFDADLVSADHQDIAFTSPLPRRLDSDWEYPLVGHPRIPSLDAEERERESLTNLAASEVVGDEDADDEGDEEGGYGTVSLDANRLRSRAGGMGSSAMQNAMQRYGAMMPGMSGMMPGMGNQGQMQSSAMSTDRMREMMQGRGGTMPMGQNPMAMGSMMGSMMGMGPMNANLSIGASHVLFRFFDFNVTPGACYRYRVKLVIRNPSYGETFVSSSDVAYGKTRASQDWSVPSTPAVVPKDVHYALSKISKRGGRRDGAILNVVQFDTNIGSLIADKLKLLYGQYVEGKVKTRHFHPDQFAPRMEEEEVAFTSEEMLVDSLPGPAISSSYVQDLKLNEKELRRLVDGGSLDQAVTVDRFGRIVELNADSHSELKPYQQRYDEQVKEYEDSAAANAPMGAGGLNVDAMDPREADSRGTGKKARLRSGLKKGSTGYGMMPGMTPGSMPMSSGMMPMMPGMQQGGNKKTGKK